jgi:hypothetical protein
MGDITVEWGGLLFDDDAYRISNLTGWEGIPPVRINDVERPNAHGSFDTPGWSGARTVVLEGYCISSEARDQLLRDIGTVSVPSGNDSPGRLKVTFAGRTLSADARVTGYDPTLRNWGVGHFGWQIQWRCADPFRYGVLLEGETKLPSDNGGLAFPLFDGSGNLEFGAVGVPGRVLIGNAGSAPAWPIFYVFGPMPGGFELVDVSTGKRLRWPSTVPDEGVVRLDSRTGTASVGGVPGYDANLTRRQWFPAPPGQNSSVQFVALGAPDPSARLVAQWAATYW